MPITVTAPEGLFPAEAEAEILPRLSAALLKWHHLSDNAFMVANVVGSLNLLPARNLYGGGAMQPVVFVELKVPSVTFTVAEQRKGFIADATQIIIELSDGKHPRTRTWVNIVYAVDGGWGIAGSGYTNAELGDAIAASQTN